MYSIEKEIKNVFFNNPDILERVVKKIIDDKMIDLTRRLTSKEAAKFLNISVKTLDNKCSNAEITYFKVGKKREFEHKDLHDYKKQKENIYRSFN
ncbi:MAG: helix-turn-helix domain-containing protein [Flavobacteriaceae bacterium]|nr:helix-turn-helix domain-containing protein [Flavobacteriaceae bacterium]